MVVRDLIKIPAKGDKGYWVVANQRSNQQRMEQRDDTSSDPWRNALFHGTMGAQLVRKTRSGVFPLGHEAEVHTEVRPFIVERR